MKKFYSFLFAAVALVGFAACNSDSTEEPAPAQQVGKMEFTANIGEDTKTQLGVTTDGKTEVLWCQDDKITVNGVPFVIKDKNTYNSAKSATFVSESEDAVVAPNYYAVYGTTSTATDAFNLSLISKLGAGNIADGSNISVAYSENSTLAFKNVVTILKFKVAAACKSVKITSTAALEGDFTVTMEEGTPVVATTSTDKEIELKGEFQTGITYYTTILPGDHQFTVTIDGKPSKSASKAMTMNRNTIYDLKTLPVEIPAPADPAVIRINNMNGWGDLAITVKSGETTLVNAKPMTKEGDTNIFKYELDAEHVGKEVTYYITHSWYQTTTKTITLADTCEPIILNTTYLQPNPDNGTYWGQGGAWFAAYFFGDGDGWVKAVKVKDNFYEVEIPVEKNYTNIIYCRMKNTDTNTLAFSNAWNQTSDLTIKHMCYCVNSWDKDSLNDSRWF